MFKFSLSIISFNFIFLPAAATDTSALPLFFVFTCFLTCPTTEKKKNKNEIYLTRIALFHRKLNIAPRNAEKNIEKQTENENEKAAIKLINLCGKI